MWRSTPPNISSARLRSHISLVVITTLTSGDVAALATSIDAVIAANANKPIGLLADYTPEYVGI